MRASNTVLLCGAILAGVPASAAGQPDGANSARSTPVATNASSAETADGGQAAAGQPQPTTPLAVHIGDADILLGGFMDMTSVVRSTATGNGLGTNFGALPFATTAGGAPSPAGNLSEMRFSAQNSRVSLMATSKVGGADLKGYLETDFLGNTAQNLNVTSNSDTLRMRLYWVQYRKGRFEFLGGQSWSMLTPNRNGISPVPADVFSSQDMDANYQLGLAWGRTPQFRFVLHATSTVTAGVSIENPQQYTGSAVVLPAAFPSSEVDTGSGGSAVGSSSPTPNLYPDIIGKIAFDPQTGRTHQHVDAAFLVSGFRTFNPAHSATYTATGTGVSVNAILEPVKNVKLLALNFSSNGGGRYIANTNLPDFIVNADFSPSLVRTWSGIYGTEITAGKVLTYAYYSLARAKGAVTFDATGQPIGYGVAGQAANRAIDEMTVGAVPTLFRDPKIGGLQMNLQYSYASRDPFAVPVNTPASAHAHIVYVDVRYILP